MYTILNPAHIGISGRQSEVIELLLTHGFRGLEVDIREFQRRVQQSSLVDARKLLDSAKLRISGFELPVELGAAEPTYRAQLAELNALAELGAAAGASVCWTCVEPATDQRPYHENFELHRKRLQEVTDILEKHGLRLGLGVLAAPAHRTNKAFQFIYQPDQLLMLIKAASCTNLGVLLDVWDWYVGGATIDVIRKVPASQVVLVRLADLPAEHDPATITENQRLAPGETGVVDAAGVIGHLSDGGYEGPVQPKSSSATLASLRRDALVQRLAGGIEQIWKAAGLNKAGKRVAATTT